MGEELSAPFTTTGNGTAVCEFCSALRTPGGGPSEPGGPWRELLTLSVCFINGGGVAVGPWGPSTSPYQPPALFMATLTLLVHGAWASHTVNCLEWARLSLGLG